MTTGSFGLSLMGSDPFGSNPLPFTVLTAHAPMNTKVIITFSDLVDTGNPALLDPGNYTITGLTVIAVTLESAVAVSLQTTSQSFVLYEAQVTTATSISGKGLDPTHSTAFFTGFPLVSAYFALATSPTRVRLVFSEAMNINAALVNPASYILTDLAGVPVVVSGVSLEQSIHPESLVLTLAAPLKTTGWYQVSLAPGVQTETLLAPLPAQQIFQWVAQPTHFSVPMTAFTGEVFGGLFGEHAGLVFFSPALENEAANSVIQVDEVDVCVKAYDEYHFPVPVDPPLFYVWSPTTTTSLLGPGSVLWAPFPRLTDFRFDLSMSFVEPPKPPPVDGPATATLQERWDPTYVALLNVPGWQLYYGVGTGVPPTFITANNLVPIPPGPTTVIPLEP